MAPLAEWKSLPIALSELCLATTLRCGQSFRWKVSNEGEWSCALHGRIVSLRQDSIHLHYRSIFPRRLQIPPTPASTPRSQKSDCLEEDDTLKLIQHYLNLTPNLIDLYSQWSAADLNFKKKAPKFAGIRILRQDAWEALICFICSSNNNISRITQMVEKLCVHYGSLIGHIGDQAYYDFPEPVALTGKNVEVHLRELGFGYRAKYIHDTALIVANERPLGWLDSLRNPESPAYRGKSAPTGEMKPEGRDGYREAHESVLELKGCGPKVADCVCLMGLGWGEAVPVDTHVWQIAQRDYKFGKGKHSSLTRATYDAVANHFRRLWGKEAGWAHSVLFTADLRAFSERLTAKVEVKEEQMTPSKKSIREPGTPESMDAEVTQKVTIKRSRASSSAVKVDEIAISSSERVKRRRRG